MHDIFPGPLRPAANIFRGGRSDVHADDGLDVRHEGGRDRGAKRGQEQEGKGHREGETTSLNEARRLFDRFFVLSVTQANIAFYKILLAICCKEILGYVLNKELSGLKVNTLVNISVVVFSVFWNFMS